MSVNLLEEDRLVYHDIAGDTCEISLLDADDTDEEECLSLKAIESDTGYRITVDVDRDAVETLRDSLTCWLETGKLTNSSPEENSSLNEFGGDLNG